jgi:hypothetical protein
MSFSLLYHLSFIIYHLAKRHGMGEAISNKKLVHKAAPTFFCVSWQFLIESSNLYYLKKNYFFGVSFAAKPPLRIILMLSTSDAVTLFDILL